MAFTLNDVVPWGRSFDEYVEMFALNADDLAGPILGCGDGPAGFNAVLTRRGGSVVSIDPLYRFTAGEIRRRIDETSPLVLAQTRQNRHEFVWTRMGSVEELGQLRAAAMAEFLADYPAGKRAGRYLCGGLPQLPFPDGAFAVALCSHVLFLYSEQLDLSFHCAALRELCRVAREARIFPLLELGARRSRHLDEVTATLAAEGYDLRIERVGYEFQKGGDELLRVRSPVPPCIRRP